VSILYSIPVHECPDCIEQMCRGILQFDDNSTIILHVSKSKSRHSFTINHPNVLINLQQFETSWGYDMSRVHISNFLYAKEKANFSHVVIIASNMLQLRDIKKEVKNNNVGYSIPRTPEYHVSALIDEDFKKGFAYHSALENSIFKQMLHDLNISDVYSCVLDGTYATTEMMDRLAEVYIKYYDFKPQARHAFEEVLFPTIICNLYQGKIYNSLTYEHTHTMELFHHGIEKKFHFAKKVERDMNNEIRKYYEGMLQ